jgi:hypothetical protein
MMRSLAWAALVLLASCRGWLGIDDHVDAGASHGDTSCPTYFEDNDHDGHGDPEKSVTSCVRPMNVAEHDDDCNDNERYAWTNRREDCDRIDNDCDGVADTCPSGCSSLSRAGVSYMVCLTPETWDTAEAKCEASGFHLAWIDDDPENTFLGGEIVFDAWLGGNQTVQGGRWVWGNGIVISAFHWGAYEPSGGDCIMSRGDKWDAHDCTNTRPYLCER